MDHAKEFVCYPCVVVRWTITTWCSIFKEHRSWSALTGVAAFLISAALHQELIDRWPAGEEFLGDPMSAVWGYLIYGVFGMGCVYVATLIGLLIAAPSQIYREQKNKIKSLTPLPLNLTFKVEETGVTTRSINLGGVTLTNHSSRRMNLTFRMLIGNVAVEPAELPGAWHLQGRSSQDGDPMAYLEADTTITGALAFKAQSMGDVSPDSDCILEINDAISRATALCRPKLGYPGGAL